ncbi:flagellar hook-associated protein FlgL [Sporosarcina sp. BP05]|uniref:flagellar hook-associated protein FlgL n=1 Tax=Sporosarcina sp. BP05 TaxID=2758726 RepID=UPI0016481FDD|nr:flagellar hook-associated protein FlgL [Sporosarcina sp. BP05]
MRVTQSMLSSNMLRNLSTSYNNMGKVQEQINTGKKVNRPSDDPVVAMKGMGYRMQVDKVAQYQRNLGEVNNYLDSSDDALDKVGSALHRVKDLMTNAPNGTLTQEDREAILSEVKQLRAQVQDLANTKVGDKYIFSGTKTDSPLHGVHAPSTEEGYPIADNAFSKSVDIEVFDGVTLNVNTDVVDMFKEIDKMFGDIENAIEVTKESSELGRFIGESQNNMDVVLTKRADIGARQNRVEMMSNRLESQEAAAKKQMSENEDIDYEKAITDMLTLESIHRAALSVGSRIIQPSLVDFLR